jgi:putative flippase GtrA|tara:strand:+ start:2064 stop:4052 length:1989 start_codon:yes stop_codon:yes gene_type:complete
MKAVALKSMGSSSLARFALTGLYNTAIGYSVILLGLWLGLGDYRANFLGYAVGLLFSYFVNRGWSFRVQSSPSIREVSCFIGAFAASYLINILVLLIGREMGLSQSPILHLGAMTAYTITFYLLSRFFVFPANERAGDKIWNGVARNWVIANLSNHRVTIASILLGLLLSAIFINIPVTHDVSWQFWLARQMNGGTPLYGHVMEINPPLWFWMAAGIDSMAKIFNIGPLNLYISMVVLWAIFAALAFTRLADFADNKTSMAVSLFVLALLLVAPIYDFGQREQLTAIGIIPYIALISRRRREQPVSWYLAISVGAFAAVGIAMKHYFVVVPMALELWLLFELRRNWRPIRWETAIMGLCAAAYAAAIIIFTPDFLSHIVPLVAAAYNGYERPFLLQVLRSEVLIWISCLAWIGYSRIRQSDAAPVPLLRALVIASLGFIAAYFAQQKGWQYHAIPATVCISLAMVVQIWHAPDTLQKSLLQKFAWQPLPTALAISYILVGLTHGTYENQRVGVEKYYSRWSPGDAVMIITGDPRLVFPHVEKQQVRWTSRHFAHWMISAIAKAENAGNSNAELVEVGRQIRQQTVEDISCHSPKYIYVNVTQLPYGISPEQFRMTDFFKRDDQFKAILENHYVLTDSDRNFDIFEAKSKVEPIPGVVCYPIW